MIPILYGSVGGEITSTVEAYLQTQGIGPLPDCPEGVVIEERNGQYELEMTYPITGRHYTDIAISCCIKVVPFVNGTPQLFEIYRMTKPINGRVKIYGRHIGYRLSYNTVTPFSLSNCTAAQAFAGLKSHAVEDCPFTFWTDFSGTAVSFKIGEPMSFRSCLGGTEGSILDLWSGEYEWDNFTVKFHNGRGTDNGVSLRYGKNITDLTQDENIENTITGIVPFWKGYDDTGSEVIVSCGPVYSVNADRFSFKRTVPHDFSPDFSEAPTVQLLQQTAQAWVTNNKIGEPDVDLTVSFVQLADTTDYKNLKVLETVNLCDTVHVEFPELGVSATSKVIRTEYDFTKDRYKSITLGSTKASNLVKTLQEITVGPALEEVTKEQTALEQAVASVTKAIRGSAGGYVKMLDTNGDGYTDEIVILDADSNGVLEDATDVWRWNNEGLGHSSTGYMGPYTTAITADGNIVADFITAGVLRGILIQGTQIEGSTFTAGRIITIHYADYSQADIDRLHDILLDVVTPTQADYDHLDVNRDGVLDIMDMSGIVYVVTNQVDWAIDARVFIDGSADTDEILKVGSTTLGYDSIFGHYIRGNYAYITGDINANSLGLYNDVADTSVPAYFAVNKSYFSYNGASQLFLKTKNIELYDYAGSGADANFTLKTRSYYGYNLKNLSDKTVFSVWVNGSNEGVLDIHDSTGQVRAELFTERLTFRDASGNILHTHYADPSNNAKLLGSTTSSSWTYVYVGSTMPLYRAFVLNACRGSGSGVMASTYIPYEQARLCTSSSVETWAHSAQNGNYSGRCYFDFTNNQIYLISSGYSDCTVKIYGIT